jgi:transketolase N-terminal domain/subunit
MVASHVTSENVVCLFGGKTSQHRVNLTKTVRKYPLDSQGRVVGEVVRDIPEPKYEELVHDIQDAKSDNRSPPVVKPTDMLDAASFPEAVKKYPTLLVRNQTKLANMLMPVN